MLAEERVLTVDDCFSELSDCGCQNGGSCRPVEEGNICDCAPAYSGTHCELGEYSEPEALASICMYSHIQAGTEANTDALPQIHGFGH